MKTYFTDIPGAISKCAGDLTGNDRITLDAQVRAYQLLDIMLGDSSQAYKDSPDFPQAVQSFLEAFENRTAEYDENYLKEELAAKVAPLEAELCEARFKAAAAESLHEFAKEVWDIWQNSGVFARRRALNELRQRAGFRLESHRIGNYVAKTYDLMNEAHAQFAKAQQAKFSADVTYMIQPGVHERIKALLG